MTTQKIAVAGSAGRMGRTLLEAIAQAPDMQLAAALERARKAAASSKNKNKKDAVENGD